MKKLFNNKRKATFYILFAIATLSLTVLLICRFFLQVEISPFALIIALTCMASLGGYVIQLRSGPPW